MLAVNLAQVRRPGRKATAGADQNPNTHQAQFSPQRDSNPRPSDTEADVSTTRLSRPTFLLKLCRLFNTAPQKFEILQITNWGLKLSKSCNSDETAK